MPGEAAIVTHALMPYDLLAAFQTSADGVYAIDAEQRIVYWNAAAERILGYQPSEAIGRFCHELLAGGEAGTQVCHAECSVMACALRGRAAATYDVRQRTRSGEIRLLNVSVIVLRGSKRRSTLAAHIFRDVTEHRRQDDRVRGLLALTAADRAQDAGTADRLTPRETEVLRLLASGLTNAQMAQALGISQTTVRNHVEHLLAKLDVHSRLEAVVYGAQHHLL